MQLLEKLNYQIDMQIIQKPSSKPSGSDRKPLLLEAPVVSALEMLANDERVSAAVMVHRMVEQVLASDAVAASFLEYVHDYWWGYKAPPKRSVHVLGVSSEAHSLLLDISSSILFAPDRTAAMLISFYSQIAKTVPTGTRALAVLAAQHQATSTQPQL